MKLPGFLKNNLDECEKENFRRSIISDNIHRGKTLAIIMIGFESVLALFDIITSLLKVDDRFHFDEYLLMYAIMICINIVYLFIIMMYEKTDNHSSAQMKKMEITIVVYLTLIMSWSSIISLMDQKLYGHVIVFMVTVITTSVIYYLDNNIILIPYLISTLILAIGLPYFQRSSDVLIGHYVNLAPFLIISWLASRMIYFYYKNDFSSKSLLQKSNLLLEQEIEENKKINSRLAIANLQLKHAAIIDELTGIPNRRGFRNYIDVTFEGYIKSNSKLSVVMIDIDMFKQFNDNYGHEEGDKVLVSVAKKIDSIVKNTEGFFCRWGGEEFIYLVLNLTKEEIENLAETIRQSICELKIPSELIPNGDYLSVSIGTYSKTISDKDEVIEMINLADKALYIAKKNGRNCVKNLSDPQEN